MLPASSTPPGWLAVYRPTSRWNPFRRRGSTPAIAPPGAAIPPRALAIWRQRPDLQAAFDLRREAGRAELFWWYLLHGYGELGLKADQDDAAVSQIVNLPITMLPDDAVTPVTPVTWLMGEFYRRHGGQFEPLTSRQGRDGLTAWYFAKALIDRRLGAFLTSAQAAELKRPVPDKPGLSRIAALIWEFDERLRHRFDDPGDEAFLRWTSDEGARDYPILAHPLVGLARPWRPPSRAKGRFGVNLIGHSQHRSGLGEDLRAAALSLEQADIPFVIHEAGQSSVIANEDASLSGRITTDLPFDLNMFSFTGMSTIAAVMANAELSRDRRFSIGLWHWELPEWPKFWQHAYDHVDEVWAASHFTYDAYCRSAGVPVRHVPVAVAAEHSEGAGRADFALPTDRFLFLSAFDGLSSVARKNPGACIAAFQAAFPDRDEPVGLVMKALRAEGDPAWGRLLAQIEDDPRIFTVTSSLSRGRLLDLYRAMDCFVSLHRSEGFGRNIAEAMLLGKPVVVSAHSGNMDFTAHDTAALVPVRLVPLADGDYPFGDGQIWGEADIVAAAEQMRRLASDAEWRTTIARAGKARIETLYSPAVVGKRWSDILRDLPH